MTEETRISFEKPLHLATIDGQYFEVANVEVLVRSNEVARLKFRIDAAGYQRMLERSLFNLHPMLRGGGELARDATDIEVTAHLRPELLADLGDVDAERIATALVERDRDGVFGALASTESWLAQAIVGKLVLPPALAGTVATGYETVWARGAMAAEPASNQPARDVVASFFATQGWDGQLIGDSLVCTTIDGDSASWRLLVRTDDARRLCTVTSIHPDAVPEPSRAEIAAFLAARNRQLDVSAFDIDMTDGEVRLRAAFFTGGASLSTAQLEAMVLANLRDFEAHLDVLGRRFRGELDDTAADALLP